MKRRCLTLAAALALWPLGTLAQSLDVLWYAYSPAGSPSGYRESIEKLAAAAPTLSPAGVRWRLTFFGPDDRPDFEAYDVLVIESSFTYVIDGLDDPDYSGILEQDAAITAARGSRTLLTGSWADMRLKGPADYTRDSQGHVLVNWVNWAGSGTGLGIVALDDEDYGWKGHPQSFLRHDYDVRTDLYYECCDYNHIPDHARDWPINEGLSDASVEVANDATDAFKIPVPEGYAVVHASINDFPSNNPTPAAGTIATASEAAGSTVPREAFWCDGLKPPLHKPLTLPTRAKPRLPVRMRLLDEDGHVVDAGDVRSAPLLTVRFGTRTQTIGPFVYSVRGSRDWSATLPNDAIRERGTHTIEAVAGDASYEIELCRQEITRR